MALSRLTDPNPKTLGPGRVYLDVKLKGAGSSAPTVDAGGRGVTVSRSAAGKYDVTLPGHGTLELASVSHTFVAGASGMKTVHISSETLASHQVQVNVRTEGDSTTNPADSDLATDEYLYLQFCIKNTSVAD